MAAILSAPVVSLVAYSTLVFCVAVWLHACFPMWLSDCLLAMPGCVVDWLIFCHYFLHGCLLAALCPSLAASLYTVLGSFDCCFSLCLFVLWHLLQYLLCMHACTRSCLVARTCASFHYRVQACLPVRVLVGQPACTLVRPLRRVLLCCLVACSHHHLLHYCRYYNHHHSLLVHHHCLFYCKYQCYPPFHDCVCYCCHYHFSITAGIVAFTSCINADTFAFTSTTVFRVATSVIIRRL